MKDDTRLAVDEEARENIEKARDAWFRVLREERIDRLHDHWNKNADPLAVWDAIAACTEQERPLPNWVIDYLRECAQRMTQAEGDFRKALPKIMAFAGKHGPHARCDDDERTADRFVFACMFCYWLGSDTGCNSLEQALEEARQVLRPEDAALDDLTLLRWIAKDFGLPTPPRSLEGWRKAILARVVIESPTP
jgi:hypothetical protein